MDQEQIDNIVALTRARLYKASRRIEARELPKATNLLREALDFYEEYCELRGGLPSTRLDAELLAETRLVNAVVVSLNAGAVDEKLFSDAAEAADVLGGIHWAQLEVCIGALRCYFGHYKDARSHLKEARKRLNELRDSGVLDTQQWRNEWRQCMCHLARAYSRLGDDETALTILRTAVKKIDKLGKVTQYDLTALVMCITLLWHAGLHDEAWAMLGDALCIFDLPDNTWLLEEFSGKNVMKIRRYMSPLPGFFMRLVFWMKLRDWLTWPWI